ncbi:MAG: YggS family pyridoxal phosphate-dependent enzyme [Prevotellaceae bacterium]|jgi:pyridoxal phosphate enzyme (YggS family)|nr:YggS family pyridoxal phosphate-dependent enzyme [Prevotellaceae bacterium]
MTLKQNLTKIKSALPNSVRLLAVSKFHPAEVIREAYDCGQRIFGESKAQELQQKVKAKNLSPLQDIEWHFIGHLQSNKVKQILPHVSLIHSVDSLKLLKEIDNIAGKMGVCANCLLEMHIAKEESKFGFSFTELEALFSSEEWRNWQNIRICGLMGMASLTENETQIRQEFRSLSKCFRYVKEKYFKDKDYFRELSMGMSGDYEIAIEEGSTLVRIGSAIFGERT